uniref:Uncharacterized protein n=1 Tax=Zea mays TaxID=4577 RepID=C0PLG9_MAIZE|nr:unknown [Zea mays]
MPSPEIFSCTGGCFGSVSVHSR